MRPLVLVLVAVALLIAVLTAVLANRYVTNSVAEGLSRQVTQRQAVNIKPVLVATRDVVLGHVLASGDLRWQDWPESLVGSGFIQQGDGEDPMVKFVGAIARTGIAAGEPIQSSRVFRQEDAGVLAGVLSPGMRAMAVMVSDEKGAAGFILPGDRVDLIMTYEVNVANAGGTQGSEKVAKYTSETVLQDVRVLGVDQALGGVKEASVKAKTVTLEVSAKQAQTVALANIMGHLTLVLRPLIRDIETPQPLGYTSDMQISHALREAYESSRQPVAGVGGGHGRSAPMAVKFFRGGQLVTETLSR